MNPYDVPAPRTIEDLAAAAKALGLSKRDLLVMAENNDPFNVGTPGKIRDAEWFTALWHRFGYVSEVHNRRVHYRAMTSGDVAMTDGLPYLNTEKCWGTLENASKYSRDLGFIDPRLFADRRNPPSKRGRWPRSEAAEPSWSVRIGDQDVSERRGWSLPRIDPNDLAWFSFNTGHIEVEGYDYDLDDQPYLIEVWIEKSTMNDVLVPLCSHLGANFTPGTGFTSKTRIAELLARAERHGKPVRVFTISDYDPAGSHMPAAVARNIEFYRDLLAPGVDIALNHIGMSREWVEKYDLPRAPIKDEDRRKANFEKAHGEGCVELDALEALHPGALADELRSILSGYVDMSYERTLARAGRDAAAEANTIWHASVAPIRAELAEIDTQVTSVTDRYRDRLTALADELAADLEPQRHRLRELWGSLVDLADPDAPTALIDLPSRPEPQTLTPDESGWLYRSSRHWWDQLTRYRSEKTGGAS